MSSIYRKMKKNMEIRLIMPEELDEMKERIIELKRLSIEASQKKDFQLLEKYGIELVELKRKLKKYKKLARNYEKENGLKNEKEN